MSALLDFIKKSGRAPQVSLHISPLDKRPKFILNQFLNYNFNSSILIPVDAFQFRFTMPNVNGSIDDHVKEGDIAELYADKTLICTGTVDVVDIETTLEGGDIVSIIGRNLIGQLEDQSAVNTTNTPMYANNVPLSSAVGSVIQNTRIRGLWNQGAPSGNFLFATEPGESKLSALGRFVEPLNCLIWGDESGNLVVGRPDMGQEPLGTLVCDRENRISNVLSIKAIRASTQIPNIILPVWAGQETVQHRVAVEQQMFNSAEGPKRLRLAKHVVQRCIVVSNPQGSDPQSLSDINAIKVGGSNLLQAYALREMARANVQELTVQVNIKSHFNDDIEPIMVDQVYNINYPRAGVQEKMYLYQVDYSCDAMSGPRTSAYFCRLGTIVAGIPVKNISRQFTPSSKLVKL